MPQLEEIPLTKVYTIRPFLHADEREVYEVCLRTCSDASNPSNAFSVYPDLVGDFYMGGFLTLNAEFCFVVEDDFSSICGYIACTPNAQLYKKQLDVSWREAMRKKYPLSAAGLERTKGDSLGIQDLIHRLHFSEAELGEDNGPLIDMVNLKYA